MGHTIWIQVPDRPDDELTGDHSVLHRLMEHLDALAVRLDVRKPSDFYDYSALDHAYADLAPAEGGVRIEPAWFAAAAGLASIRALRARTC
jgi:hypothetical protein